MQDRREHQRHAVEIDGKLIFADGRCAFDCVIIELSEGGARVRLSVEVDLPRKVYFWQMKTGSVLDCEVRWQEHKLVGLRFIDSCGRHLRKALIKACQPSQGRISRWIEGSRS
jgi:hypothetical protein